jgi:UrcA family protein
VSYAGLDLNTPAGQASLKARLSAAARDVCGPEPDNRDLRASMDFHACRKMALKAALAAVPAPTEMAGSTGHKS